MRSAIFGFFVLCLLLFLVLLAGRHSDNTPDNYCCLFPLLCVFLWMYRLISVGSFLVERGTGRIEHGLIVAGISLWVWCLVSACSSSWYVFGRGSKLRRGIVPVQR